MRLSCKALHAKRILSVLLKINIAKAFDSVSWVFLLEVLQHMGFGRQWRNWISVILGTAITKILLNGVPGRRICHARGLRQGDPLSPMLFMLAMEVINRTVMWLDSQGFLSGLGVNHPVERVSLYADDMVLFVAPLQQDLVVLKLALEVFGLASGLFANLDKSVATPLHCAEEDITRIQQILACRVEGFPSRYLGIPLSIFRLKRSDEQPLIDAVAARIPLWKGNLLNIAGRTTLARSTLSAIPVHIAIALYLSSWAIQCIDKLRRGFIWSGTSSVTGGQCKVAWEICCRPRELGGLGVVDLRRTGIALRLRWPWLGRTDNSRPWPSLPNVGDRAVNAFFATATISILGAGESTHFWTDNWLKGTSIRHLAPAVFAGVPKRKWGVTVAEALQGRSWVLHISGPRTLRMLAEFINLCQLLEHVQLEQGVPDVFACRLSTRGQYSASSAYGAMFFGCSRPLGARLVWKTSAPPRIKFFFWLVLHGRCWTAHRRWRHGLQDTCSCIIYDQAEETMDHIILGCVFSREVWESCLRTFRLNDLITVHQRDIVEWWLRSRKCLP